MPTYYNITEEVLTNMKAAIEAWTDWTEHDCETPANVTIAELPQAMEYPHVSVMAVRSEITRPSNTVDENAERYEWACLMPLDPKGSNENYIQLVRLAAEFRRIVRNNRTWSVATLLGVAATWVDSWEISPAQIGADSYAQMLTVTMRVIFKEDLRRES